MEGVPNRITAVPLIEGVWGQTVIPNRITAVPLIGGVLGETVVPTAVLRFL